MQQKSKQKNQGLTSEAQVVPKAAVSQVATWGWLQKQVNN